MINATRDDDRENSLNYILCNRFVYSILFLGENSVLTLLHLNHKILCTQQDKCMFFYIC